MNEDVGKLLLRVGLGGVFVWFGVDKFFHPDLWINYIPLWFPFASVSFIYVLGVVESLLGLLVLAGFGLASLACALMLVPIMFSLGFNELFVRDFGLFCLALGIYFIGSGKYVVGGRK